MNPKQLKDLIARVLKSMGHYSREAVDLLMVTAAQESHCGHYIRQIGGPALGIFQMEPETLLDIYENYLPRKPQLARKLSESRTYDRELDLEGNLLYQIVAARVHFLRVPKAIPKREWFEAEHAYVSALAGYWKQYWNTLAGKGSVKEAVQNYNIYVREA